MKRRIIELNVNNRQEFLKLSVNPASIVFTDMQNNQDINSLEVGTALLLGNRGLITTTLESFFPSEVCLFIKDMEGLGHHRSARLFLKNGKIKI